MQVGFDSDRGGVERRLLAQTASVTRYDQDIQNKARQVLQKKKELSTVQASVEDGVVTLTGTVDLYQNKLDAARKVRKLQSVAGVRNLITVAGPSVADEQLADQLSRKLYYDRDGYYDGPFNYFTLAVKDGVVTVGGETLSDVGRDSALSLIQRTPGVKDVISNIAVSPVSLFDDNLRRRAVLVIYRDPVMSKYAIDPARPIPG